MKEFRIKKIKTNDKIEFFPEHYDEEYKNRMCRVDHDGWFSISEQHKKILGIGYDTIEKAEKQIILYKNQKSSKIEVEIYEYES